METGNAAKMPVVHTGEKGGFFLERELRENVPRLLEYLAKVKIGGGLFK
jgi:hypothetical protein